jgi:hypothetical protein
MADGPGNRVFSSPDSYSGGFVSAILTRAKQLTRKV